MGTHLRASKTHFLSKNVHFIHIYIYIYKLSHTQYTMCVATVCQVNIDCVGVFTAII